MSQRDCNLLTFERTPQHRHAGRGVAAAPKSYKLLIDGKFVDARDGRTLERQSPGHGFVVSHYAQAGEADVELAVQAAHRHSRPVLGRA